MNRQQQQPQERNMLSVASKNETTKRRQQWVCVQTNIGQIKRENMGEEFLNIAREYQEKIEGELSEICKETIELVEGVLLPRLLGGTEHYEGRKEGEQQREQQQEQQQERQQRELQHHESPKTVTALLNEAASSHSPRYKSDQKIFYLKMIGDYHRYLAEIQRGEARIPHAMRSQDAYEKALEIARDPKAGVATTHPVRLGLSLNYSVFHHEIREDTKTALEIAQTALDEGLEDLDALTDNPRVYKDAALILKLIKDNISMWQSYTSSSESSKEAAGVNATREQLSKTHIEEKDNEDAAMANKE